MAAFSIPATPQATQMMTKGLMAIPGLLEIVCFGEVDR